MALQSLLSGTAQSFQLNGQILGGVAIDTDTGGFDRLPGGKVDATIDSSSLNVNIAGRSIVQALNSVYAAAAGIDRTQRWSGIANPVCTARA